MRSPVLAGFVLILSVIGTAGPSSGRDTQDAVLPLGFFGRDSLPMVDVVLAGRRIPFILDFGAGITVISKQLCDTLRCRAAGRLAGVRHTGEVLEFSLVTVPTLQLGPVAAERLVVATMDLSPWQQGAPVGGVLSLQLLEHTPFTLDLSRRQLILGHGPATLEPTASAVHVEVALIREHPSTVTLALPVSLDGQRFGWGLVDTGSPQTYVHVYWEDLLKQHGRILYGREERAWTGRRDSVQYWSVRGLAPLGAAATRDSFTVGVKRMIPDAVIGLDRLRTSVLSCDLEGPWCSLRPAR